MLAAPIFSASRSNGLGDGSWDISLQADVYQTFGRWRPYASVGYRMIHRPAGSTGHDVWFASIGTTYDLTDRVAVSAFFDARERPSASGLPAKEVTLQWDLRVHARVKLQLYALRGLADGSPDHGAGFTLIYYY